MSEIDEHVLRHELHVCRDAVDWLVRERNEARAEAARLKRVLEDFLGPSLSEPPQDGG